MKVLTKNDDKVVMEFTKEEYFQIRNWMIGKKAGKIDIDTRDTLESFIAMRAFLNPKMSMMSKLDKVTDKLISSSFKALYYKISKDIDHLNPYTYNVQLSDIYKYIRPELHLNTMLHFCSTNGIDLGNYKFDIEGLIQEIKRKYKIFQKYYSLKVLSLQDPEQFLNRIEEEFSKSGFDKRKIVFLKKEIKNFNSKKTL